MIISLRVFAEVVGSSPSARAYKQELLASPMSMYFEPFQRTDISMKPLGPAPQHQQII